MLSQLNLKEVLDSIDYIVSDYQSGVYMSQEKLMNAQRELSANTYWLTSMYLDYKKEFYKIIYNRPKLENGKKESVASAEARAENEVPEMYICKKILEACKNVSICIHNEIELMKKDI